MLVFRHLKSSDCFHASICSQADNGREFSKVAGHGKGKFVDLSGMMEEIVTEIAALWPECKIVHGRARHSPSQVEPAGAEAAQCMDDREQKQRMVRWLQDRPVGHRDRL